MMCKKPFMRTANINKAQALRCPDGLKEATPFGCGQCLPCRINAARVWTHRLLLEGAVNEESCFVTLTYEDMPEDGDVSKVTLQKFIKRLRRNHYEKIRMFGS